MSKQILPESAYSYSVMAVCKRITAAFIKEVSTTQDEQYTNLERAAFQHALRPAAEEELRMQATVFRMGYLQAIKDLGTNNHEIPQEDIDRHLIPLGIIPDPVSTPTLMEVLGDQPPLPKISDELREICDRILRDGLTDSDYEFLNLLENSTASVQIQEYCAAFMGTTKDAIIDLVRPQIEDWIQRSNQNR